MRLRYVINGMLGASLLAASAFSQDSPVAATLRLRGLEGSIDLLAIRCSDVRVQMALQPGTKLEPPRPDDFATALRSVIDQGLLSHSIGMEAHLFEWSPTEQEIRTSITRTASYFPTLKDFEKRLIWAGFDSINDEKLKTLMRDRVVIEKYIAMHFRNQFKVTREMEEKYYEEVFIPEFRRQYPDRIVPALSEKQVEVGINSTITEKLAEAAVSRFLERKRRLVKIEMSPEQCLAERPQNERSRMVNSVPGHTGARRMRHQSNAN